MSARSITRPRTAALGAASLLASAALLAQDGQRPAQDVAAARDDTDRTPVRCVPITNIDRMEAVDDRTLLFFLRGDRVYTNELSRVCPGMQRENRFAYRTYGQLCNGDAITVLDARGVGFQSGFTCGLGLFYPTSEQQAERLTGREWRGEVRAEAIELPEQPEADAQAETADSPNGADAADAASAVDVADAADAASADADAADATPATPRESR